MRCFGYDESVMHDLAIFFIHVLVTIARLFGPGGARSIVAESLILKSHWVMVVTDQFTRRIIGFAVHAGVLNESTVCRMFNSIFGESQSPRYLRLDNNPLFLFRQ